HRRPEAAVHVEGDGNMLVHELPATIELPKGSRYPHPEPCCFSTRLFPPDTVEPRRESDRIADRDLQICRLPVDGAVPCREPCLQVFPVGVRPTGGEWRGEIV